MNNNLNRLKSQSGRNSSSGFLFVLCEQYHGAPPSSASEFHEDCSAVGTRLRTRAPAAVEPVRFLFPDVGVWLALSDRNHKSHERCHRWFRKLGPNVRLCFCSATQVGLLKRLTGDPAVAGEKVLHHDEAWDIRDEWARDPRIMFLREPLEINDEFRALSDLRRPNCKSWTDLYLIAFAQAARVRLVTMNRALCKHYADAELLP